MDIPTKAQIYKRSKNNSPLRQCEIITDLVQIKPRYDGSVLRDVRFDVWEHPFSIIVSQDCDLEQDYRSRFGNGHQHRIIPNVLFCIMITAEDLRNADDVKQRGINSKAWTNIANNKNERYHFFQAVDGANDLQRTSLPELCTDFNAYFTIPTDEVYAQLGNRVSYALPRRRCVLRAPYSQHFCSRYHFFQSRVALPSDHESQKQ